MKSKSSVETWILLAIIVLHFTPITKNLHHLISKAFGSFSLWLESNPPDSVDVYMMWNWNR